MHSDFETIRKKYGDQIEVIFQDFFRTASQQTGSAIAEMSDYHFQTGGKRLRALIPSYIYESLNLNGEQLLPFGAAVEMIHNATLVHDDLQDGDEVRRGRPTIWKKYSPAQAINCGDAMFQYAFQLLGQLQIDPSLKLKLYDRAVRATLRVIEGQAQEFIMKDEIFPNFDRYLEVIRGKTSGLFALPVVGALEAANIETSLCSEFEKITMDLGVLFQIQDDVLDIYGDKGRSTRATDVAEGKVSVFVALLNQFGTEEDKSELRSILKLPREQTTDAHITKVIQLFEKYDCRPRAMGYIQKIQNELVEHHFIRKELPRVHACLISLADQFLKPISILT